MSKTATIRARIEPDLKNEVEDILSRLGLSASEAILLLYRQIQMRRGLPFAVAIPNELTAKTLRESKSGKKRQNFRKQEGTLRGSGLVRTFSRTAQFKKDVKRAGKREGKK